MSMKLDRTPDVSVVDIGFSDAHGGFADRIGETRKTC